MPAALTEPRATSTCQRRLNGKSIALGLAGVAALSVGVHLRALTRPFILDDWAYLRIGQSRSDVWTYVRQATKPIYRPALQVWFSALERAVGIHPVIFHVAALALLLAASGLFYVLARRLDLPPGAALGGSAVLALHPALDQTIAWSSAVNALLVIVFSLAALLTLLPPCPGWRYLLLGGMFAVLALSSREDAVVLPAVAFLARAASPGLFDLPVRQRYWRALVPTWPLWLVVILIEGLRFHAGASSKGTVYEMSLGIHVLHNAMRLLEFLIGPPLLARPEAWASIRWAALTALIGVILLGASAIAALRRRPAALVGVLWALLALLPPIGLVRHAMDPYYVDLAIPGLALAVAGALAMVSDLRRGATLTRRPGLILAACIVLIAAGAAYAGRQQQLLPVAVTQVRRQNQLLALVGPHPPPSGLLCLLNGQPDDQPISVGGDLFRADNRDPTLAFAIVVDGKLFAHWPRQPSRDPRQLVLLVDSSPGSAPPAPGAASRCPRR